MSIHPSLTPGKVIPIKTSKQRGGKRPGAGRKPNPNGPAKTRGISVSDTAWQWLRDAGATLDPPTTRSGWLERQAKPQE